MKYQLCLSLHNPICRSPQLKPNELQDIVFLCTALPTPKTFEAVSRFPKVYFMLVSSIGKGVYQMSTRY